MADAHFASVQLLLRANGTDGSTAIVDESNAARGMTARGNAQLDTAQKKYGTASMLFDGTGDAVTPNSVTGLTASGDFTVEFWVRPNSGAYAFLFCPNADWWIDTDGLFYDPDGLEVLFGSALSTSTFQHVEWDRAGSTNYLFLNGVLQGTFTKSGTITASSAFYTIGGSYVSPVVSNSLNGWIDDFRKTIGVARHTANFTPPGEHELGGVSGHVSAPSPLGAPAFLGSSNRINVRASAPSPLGAPALVGFTDWTGRLAARQLQQFVMDLVTPAGDVRVPISSWQATLTTSGECYAGCVVPACMPWLQAMETATHFVIARRAVLADGEVFFVPMVRCPIESLQIDRGNTNFTASLSGYFDAIVGSDAPPERYDRELSNARSTTVYGSTQRVRSDIDWLLRPGQRALVGADSLVVDYMNLYVTINGMTVQAYMDVGERVS